MKRISLGLLTLFLLTTWTVFAHHHEMQMWKSLPSQLGLSSSQYASYNLYFNQMHDELKKDHEKAMNDVRQVLSTDQFHGLMAEMKTMMKHHKMGHDEMKMKTDDEVKAMVSEVAKGLLLTANQEMKLQWIALTMNHKKIQLMNTFFSRLNRILSTSQQAKLAQFKARCE